MRFLILLISILILGNCSGSKQDKNRKESLIPSPQMEIQYKKDKQQIADCFIKNVEYFRKYHRYEWQYVDNFDSLRNIKEVYYKKYPGADWDPANFFEPYATRFDLKNDEYINSPIPTDQQLTVTTDTIVYSKDSLFCVAILIVKGNYTKIANIEEGMVAGREYDAKALIGYRTNIEKPFDIYPLKKHSVIGFESYEAASIMLRDLYFNKLKGIGSTGSVYEGLQFKRNVGDKDFFEKSPYFKKHKNGMYNFQMYRHLGKDYPYQYLSCKD